jgi:hypothetical protein
MHYFVWHDRHGQTSGLPADGNGSGEIDSGDYNVGKNHFGQTSGSGVAGSASVRAGGHESSSALFLTFGGFLLEFFGPKQ